MGDSTENLYADEELDLRRLVKLVSQRWRMILVFSLLGGLMAGAFFAIKQTNYAATTTVAVDTGILASKTSPTFLLLNEDIKSEVAGVIDAAVLEDSDILITSDKSDKTIYYISAVSTSPEQAINIANTWSNTSIAWILQAMSRTEDDVTEAKTQLANTNDALTSYLNENKLASLTWNDLTTLTGTGTSDMVVIEQSNDALPVITQNQRAILSELMIQKISAEWNYERVIKDVLERNYQMKDRVKIIEYAEKAEPASFLDSRFLIPVGVFIGLLLSLVWIILKNWWDCSPTSAITAQESNQPGNSSAG